MQVSLIYLGRLSEKTKQQNRKLWGRECEREGRGEGRGAENEERDRDSALRVEGSVLVCIAITTIPYLFPAQQYRFLVS